ncbi:hypothetical protein GC096_03710 [Paenibacillus sp. LMG 31461]|uniref:Phage protein n=1 Tax=Paenibacillus plantarum TaxID=2654975 RepID=A0ABX1X4F9_9BACL|nr:hypothetical protein [Paenibacillus plantarum]NOU63152.1 hypothetical protein [Paenibacillus plantarum]
MKTKERKKPRVTNMSFVDKQGNVVAECYYDENGKLVGDDLSNPLLTPWFDKASIFIAELKSGFTERYEIKR